MRVAQWHSSRVFTPLTGWHCKFHPNTEGAEEDGTETDADLALGLAMSAEEAAAVEAEADVAAGDETDDGTTSANAGDENPDDAEWEDDPVRCLGFL
jgi:hypothetical protein